MKHIYCVVWGVVIVQLTSMCGAALTKNYTAYRPYPNCCPSEYMRYPTTASDVVAIVNEAIVRGIKVKAFGARHSQTDIICTEGIPVDMSQLNFCEMNSDGVTASFGPGVTVKEAGEFLLTHGRALRTTPAYGGITLGGAIGTGAHGSTLKYNATISAQVVGLTIVNGLGQQVEISDPVNLKAFRVHLGLLGIVVSITLYTEPLYKVYAYNYVVPQDILTNGTALEWARTSDQITFYWFPSTKEVVVTNLTFVSVNTTGNAYSNAFAPPTYGYFNLAGNQAKEIAYDLITSECAAASGLGNQIANAFELAAASSLVVQTPGFVPVYTEDGVSVENPAVGYPHSMFAAFCSEEDAGLDGEACFYAHGDIDSNITVLDNEFSMDINDLAAFVAAAEDIMAKTPTIFPLNGVYMRFAGMSDAYMSTDLDRDTVHIEFTVWKRTDSYNDASGSLAGYQTLLQTMAKRFKSRSHWGKSGFVYHGKEMLDLKLKPEARASFIAAMNQYDPNGLFMNNFGRRIKENGTKVDSDPCTTRCALLDECFCSENSDCADTQTCTYLPGYPDYPVCKTINEIPEMQYDESVFPPPAGFLNWLTLTVPNLAQSTLALCPPTGLLDPVTTLLGV